jgi:2,4-dienoyl-CoA reductase-like NADH-dependent reductase (Old Yellow Enzyme family)
VGVPDVFSPVSLGPLTLRNRVVKAATFEGLTPGAVVSQHLIDFHVAIARGGVGMTTMAYLAVSPEGRTHRDQVFIREAAMPGLRRLTGAVQAEGAAVAAQIGHAGPVANGRSNGAQAVAPTRMPSPLSMQMIRGASEQDLDRILRDYVAGVRLAVRAGFDALELHLGHGYLLSSFLSPNINRRRDRYGGSLENRARFPLRVLRAIREEVGDEVALYAKLGMTDGIRGGLRVADSLEVAATLEAERLVDAIELSAGSSLTNPMYFFRGPVPMREFAATMPLAVRLGLRTKAGKGFLREYPYEEGFLLDDAKRFRERLSLPLIALGGISTKETMDRAMAEGFDLVALGRPLLRNPDLVNRMQAGELTASTCTHCNLCMPSIYTGTRCVLDHPEPLVPTVGFRPPPLTTEDITA